MELRRLALLLGLGLVGCNAGHDAAASIPARPPGLIRVAQTLQDSPSPHLTEAVVHGDFVYVGNSNELFAIYRMQGNELELALRDPGGFAQGRRCTTLAVHEPTSSLFCGNDDFRGILRYDIDDPVAPKLDGDDYNPPLEGLRVSDMVVVGDRLVLARYDRGLATIEIGEDGRLEGLVEQLEIGNVRKLDLDADGRLWALTGDRGLLVLEQDPGGDHHGEWIERWQLELDGPPLGLGVDGSRAAVGLGSAGLAIVELDSTSDSLRLTTSLHPPGVVSAADVRGDAAVAVTLLGVFAYDLREPEAWPEDPRGEQTREEIDEGGARLIGFVPAGPWDRPGDSGTLLDGALLERDGRLELITTDWTWVERLALDLDGFPAGIDVRRGEWLAAEDETVEIVLRNPTPFLLRVDYQAVGDESWRSAELEPRATATLRLPASRFEIDTPQLVILRVFDGDAVVDTPAVTVMRRSPLEVSPVEEHGRPPPGAAFPRLTLATGWPGSIEPLVVPKPGVAQRVVFYGIDCAAMWPEVEDVLWRVRSGRVAPDAIVLVSNIDPTIETAFERWGLADATWGYFMGPFFPPEFAEQNPYEELYEDGFVIYELPSAAHHPTDYVYDADANVTLVEREYRGEHELVAD